MWRLVVSIVNLQITALELYLIVWRRSTNDSEEMLSAHSWL
jgi:hypothetical protein